MAPPPSDSRLAIRPLFCLITDRTRLRRAIESDGRSELVEFVRRAALAGVNLIQIRERDLEGGSLYELACECIRAMDGTDAQILINERVDVAIAAGAAGVHLRGDSPKSSRARTMSPDRFLIGRSVHSTEEAIKVTADGGIDYLIAGTVFSTPSKADGHGHHLGLAGLRDIVAHVEVPVLAIGGVTLDVVEGVAATGAAGFAAIRLFADADATKSLAQLLHDSRRAFDRA